nr:hypothetical protein [Tanacetum cinerariifolium]
MDDPNITMEEYIRLEEEKARKLGKVFNWETAKYGKILYDEDVYDLRSVETEFPAIAFNDHISSIKHFLVNPRKIGLLEWIRRIRINLYGVSTIFNLHMALLPRDQRHRYLRREVYRVKVFDFGGLSDLMAEGLSARMLMEHKDAQGTVGFGAYWTETLSYIAIWDPILRLCHRLIACSIAGRSQAHEKGLTVISPELSIIDMVELVRLEICMEVDDTWAWVAMGLERHPDAEGGSPRVAQDAPAVDEGVQAVLTPMQLMEASGLTYQAFDGTF